MALPEKTQLNFLKVTKRIFERMTEAWAARRSGCLMVEIHFACGGTSKDRCQAYFVENKTKL